MADGFLQSLWASGAEFLSQIIPNYIIPNIRLIIWIIVLLIAAYITGKIAKWIVVKSLSLVGLKRVMSRSWAESILKITGYRGTVVGLIGDLVKWLVYLMFLGFIIQTAGLPGIADLFTQLAVFMPRAIGAIFIVVIGFLVADFFGRVFEEAGRKMLGEEILATLTGGVARYFLAIVSIIMALSLIGIETISLLVMFSIILATIMVLVLMGLKDSFPNFAAGLALKAELKPGERVTIGEYSGTVEKVNALNVLLSVSDKKTVSIPSSYFLKHPIEKTKSK